VGVRTLQLVKYQNTAADVVGVEVPFRWWTHVGR
jgi:hypothetical protein